MLWLRWPHFCARALGWVAGVTVILLAVLMALAQLLLPLLARHPAWVAAQLSQRVQRPVTFASLEGRWTPSGPLFVMHNVTVGMAPGEQGSVLQLPESELKLDFGGWLLPTRHLLNLHVRGMQLDLARDANGWHVNGIGVAGGTNKQPFSPGRLSLDLWLEDLRVDVTDTIRGKHYTLLAPQLRLSRQGSQIRFGGRLQRGGVNTALRMAGRFREDGSSGQVWLGAEDVELKPLLDGIDMDGYTADQGHGRLSAWLDWRKGRLTNSLIRFDLDALAVSSPAGATASVPTLHGLAGLRQTSDGYDARWVGDDGSALALSLHRPDSPQMSVGVAARELQLAPLLPWLALAPNLPPGLAHWLGGGQPHGDLSQVALQWDRASGLRGLHVTFQDLGIDPVGKLPGLNDLHGEFRGDAEAVSLELPDQPATLQFAHLFRQPFVLSKLAGTLAFWQQDDGWHIGADALDFVGTGYAGQARGEAILPAQGGAPFLNLYASVDHADVPAARLFWPVSVMPPQTVAWLDRALVAGQIDQAQVLVRGDMADWPFHHNEGRFEARAQIRDLTFNYGDAWPRAEGVNAVANFINSGMLIEVDGGQSLGVKADKAVALIPDFGEGLLDLNVQGSGSGASLMNFVRKSPIASQQADTLAKLSVGGNGTFDFHLSLPLKKIQDAQLSGTAQLKDADLSAADWNLKLDKLNGPLHFDLHGMQAGPLDAGFHGQPSKLQLAIAGANSDPSTVLSAQLQGSYQVAELVQDYPSLNWLGQLANGRSDFNIGFAIAHIPGRSEVAQTLSVDSPLSGIALDLPTPLHKPAPVSLPLHLTMSLPVSGSDLQVALGQVMRAHFRLSAADSKLPLTGTLAFGSQMPDVLPVHDLRIRGHASELDVTGWVQRAAAGSGGSGPGLESIDVSTDQAQLFGQSVGVMKIKATPQVDTLSVDVDGAALAGNFSVPTQDMNKRGITARLQRLYWPKSSPAPVGTAAPSAASAPTGNPANTGINPAALPPFHLWVSDLRVGDAKLGEARLETWPTASGQHIEQLRALSSQVQINASGDWNGSATDSHTQMKISFSAEDLGAMLSALGYDGLVQGGKTQDELDASWPGSPIALSLATMNGTLSIHVSDGHIPDASPGAGRLLGLVSLGELPRRLSLDFGDVFGKGFAFDSITGDFKLADGNATTSNMEINGPAANIRITGRTGLRAKDYDQQMLEIPHVGNSLPIVGAVVGGPIGAAAGFAVQGLLGKGLNHAAIRRYHITGTWDKPVMILVEKRDIQLKSPLAAPSLSPAPASSVLSPLAAPAPAGSAGSH
ncbi:YhdP family protein [Rhodanobacter sp. C05]|uniref:YhdP family protein n=1 Tax=Rhodanobacter sp. C05 TaxID=1945855 RepID=UPI0009D067DD|nr:YhdP family protein [Rhodanobacter sp. C05]OOG39301.1 TIGR02099 family protein [Rhodanobacter sp. C05]